MKKSFFALLIIIMSSSVFALSRVAVPEELPVNKCEENLEVKLQNFADDLTKFVTDNNASMEEAQESFDWMILEVASALNESPPDCEYAVDFVERQHKEFLEEAYP